MVDVELTRVYGIVGFYRVEGEEKKTPFGGYFEYDPDTDFVIGERIDAECGSALFAGKIDNKLHSLRFNLRYAGRRDEIYYAYRREGDVWVGEFKLHEAGKITSKGTSLCNISRSGALPKTLEARGLGFPIFLE